MTLPKIEVPTYELTLPSTDLKVKYRPFLVKEEKILFIALESNNNTNIVNAIKDIVSTCTFNSISISNLPVFDLEYIFLNIRAKSVGEVAKFKVLCNDDKKTYVDVEIDLTKVEVQVDEKHTNKIIIDKNKNLGMVLRYPTINDVELGENVSTLKVESVFKILANCIDHIFEGDKIYPAKDISKEELQEFLESLPQDNFNDIRDFFDTMPKLKHKIEVLNPKTNVKNDVFFVGLSDFFE
jgi:hypothetical protein